VEKIRAKQPAIQENGGPMTAIALAGLIVLPQMGSAAMPTLHLLEGKSLTLTVAQEEPPLPPPPIPPSYEPPPPPLPLDDVWVPSLGMVIPLMVGGGVIALVGIPVTLYGFVSIFVGCYQCSATTLFLGGIGEIVVGSILFFVGNHYRGVRNQLLSGHISVQYEPKSRVLAMAMKF
jgi:hypothetical protein